MEALMLDDFVSQEHAVDGLFHQFLISLRHLFTTAFPDDKSSYYL